MYLVLNDNNSIILQTDKFEEVNKAMTLNRETKTFLDINSIPLLIDSLEKELERNESLQKEITLVKEENFQFQQLVDDLNKELEDEVKNTKQLQEEITLLKKDNSEMKTLYHLAKTFGINMHR